MRQQRQLIIASLLASASLAIGQHTSDIEIPSNLSTRSLVRDVYGYSVEPVAVNSFVNNTLMSTLMQAIKDVTGKAPPIRVGGNTADQTYLVDSLPQNASSLEITTPTKDTEWNVTSAWYSSWANYFPEGTDIIYTLNLRDNLSSWSNAQAEAEVVWNALGDKLVMFELGNEIDHFINKGWRTADWGVVEYSEQFRTITEELTNASWYVDAADSAPKFQAAVFADPPWVPDQHDEIDDFDIVNLTKGGLVDPAIIETYAVHLYPQSTCDTKRWYRLSLDLLSNHTTLWLNVSQYVPQVAAADAANATLVFGETNSASCSGRSGISDTFGAALWGVDYVLMAASIGMGKVYFHLGNTAQYSAFTPEPYVLQNDSLEAGIRANWYGHYFVSKVVEGLDDGESYGIAALPGANASDLSGYAVYKGEDLSKLVFLDMGVWNSTGGLSNPSTLSNTDGTIYSQGKRPSYNMSVTSPWSSGQNISITRLSGPGTNAKSEVNVSGVTFDTNTGEKQGSEVGEYVQVGDNGVIQFPMVQAEGILLQVVTNGSSNSSGDGSSTGGDTSAASKISGVWGTTLTTAVVMAFLY